MKLPSECPMVEEAIKRCLHHLGTMLDSAHDATEFDHLCFRLKHIAQASERHAETLRALGSLQRDSADWTEERTQ